MPNLVALVVAVIDDVVAATVAVAVAVAVYLIFPTTKKLIERISVVHDDAINSMCKYISSCRCFISDSLMHLSPFIRVIHRDSTELSNRCY